MYLGINIIYYYQKKKVSSLQKNSHSPATMKFSHTVVFAVAMAGMFIGLVIAQVLAGNGSRGGPAA